MIKGLIISARPGHWVKNLVIFAALIFAVEFTNIEKWGLAILAFATFCMGSSAVYIMNDVFDREKDRNHPIKSKRPIASGEVSLHVAIAASVFLGLTSILISININTSTMIALIVYLIINLGYSAILKQLVIIDVMVIAVGFVVRAVAGGLAISVPISPWLLVCTTLLALFLAFGKRRHELVLLSNNATNHRKSLENYSTPFLDQMISVVTASTVVAYSFYTMSPEIETRFGTQWLSLTIPFVLYGIFRYLYLIFKKEEGGNPTKLMITDMPLLICVVLWLLTVILVIRFT